ncbi:MAG: General L-amino acid-binding periplasmic protein AapJ precursor [Alphaproteobacteria bacterium ADurb.Bin438]|nr:MAG: General L-amino acid-binding periplasmic protein AapJ precursor [Alphaproteobacteria bacterium ADurb.Bin438]
MKNILKILFYLLFATVSFYAKADDLSEVVNNCGINIGIEGLSSYDSNNKLEGFDVEFCKAFAVAYMNDENKVRFVDVALTERFDALLDKRIDILFGNTTINFNRSTIDGILFSATSLFDKQFVLIKDEFNVERLKELDGKTLTACYLNGSNNKDNLLKYLNANNIKLSIAEKNYENNDFETFTLNDCDLLMNDSIYLNSYKNHNPHFKDYHLLEDEISFDAMSLVVRRNVKIAKSMRIIFYTMVLASEKGLNSGNIDKVLSKTKDYEILKVFSKDSEFAKEYGMIKGFAYNIVKKVGSYSEIYEKTLGKYEGLKSIKDKNKILKEGGLIFAPPIGK